LSKEQRRIQRSENRGGAVAWRPAHVPVPCWVEDGHDAEMVTYTDEQPPTNRYPHQLISPPRAGVCCVSAMEWLDAPPGDVRGVYRDRRCRQCDFAVRVILCEILGATVMNSLRE